MSQTERRVNAFYLCPNCRPTQCRSPAQHTTVPLPPHEARRELLPVSLCRPHRHKVADKELLTVLDCKDTKRNVKSNKNAENINKVAGGVVGGRASPPDNKIQINAFFIVLPDRGGLGGAARLMLSGGTPDLLSYANIVCAVKNFDIGKFRSRSFAWV